MCKWVKCVNESRAVAILLLIVILAHGCTDKRRVAVPLTFLESISYPQDSMRFNNNVRTMYIVRSTNERIELLLPQGGTSQSTWLYHKGFIPYSNQSDSIIVRMGVSANQGPMIYELDTLSDGQYLMGASGDGYVGYFFIDVITR